ncbi:AAA family ATPase [Flavobacterium sp. DGU11]|uniref:AAA family ATPase n=1 Tax=Flavobacterium arundinis TaxID=3139143 RepID=A0ABU9I2A1_9FLAO
MLIRFTVSNFMSFKDETEFNMLPASGNGSRKLKNHIHTTDSGIEVLRTAAIYGANAAGKSNLVSAISYLKNIVFGDEAILMPQSKRFRIDKNYKNKPTTFRIEYTFKNNHFDYGIEISKGKIQQEWLYLIKSVAYEKEELLYKRENQDVTFGDYFKNSSDFSYITKYLKKELRDTQTVIDACFGNIEDSTILDDIYIAFAKLTIVMPTSKSFVYSESILTGNKSFDFAKNLLTNSKTGIEDLILNEIDADAFFSYSEEDLKKELIDDLESFIESNKDKSLDNSLPFLQNSQINVLRKRDNKYYVSFLKTKHFNTDDLFDFSEESDGTKRLFELSPAFEQLIFEGDVVYIVDELERSMHPLLAKELLRMYSAANTFNSQLIFTTHESHLLDNDLLRRDEIWFTEKKTDGSTEFYPLSNFNPRGDKVLERGYLEGRYGGIPFLGDFSNLIIEDSENVT